MLGTAHRVKPCLAPPMPKHATAQTPERTSSNPGKPSTVTAIHEQLGLKLDLQNAHFEILVIDRAEKPSDNRTGAVAFWIRSAGAESR